ncbi:hypothetical protein X798_06873 [Onchocerca flexuosa]|uniref:USP domain-containing protein n=1 Tax=Onchocerca flexuosa TaxID=387005 RepID=A0A238BMS0_9BILA|nr:hypothetical protein X798_06873 [Onchocerca flexuosa]
MMPFTVHGLAQAEGEISKELTHSPVTDSGRGTSERVSPETNDACGATDTSTSESKLDDNKFVVSNFMKFTQVILDNSCIAFIINDFSSTKYCLRGVIVHSGQANGGHYYSFIRSEEDGGRWFKFDDTDVIEWHLNKEVNFAKIIGKGTLLKQKKSNVR